MPVQSPLRSTLRPLFWGVLLALGPLQADEGAPQHGAHEHGVATLSLAQEGVLVELELRSPAMNLVGFEHPPASPAEHAALAQALSVLNDGAKLFRFPAAAGCTLESVAITNPWGQGPAAPGGAGSLPERQGEAPMPGHEQDHADDKDHAHDRDHDDGDAHAGHAGQSHADISARYHLRCASPKALSPMETGLFAAFPNTTRLSVEFVTDDRQGAAELRPETAILSF